MRANELRIQLVRQMMGDQTEGEARDIYLKVREYECHPLDIENLQEVLENVHGKGWKYTTVLNTNLDLPIPKFKGENLANRWRFVVRFAYHKEKRHFKALFSREVVNKSGCRGVYHTGHHHITLHCRRCDLNRSFIYELRDKLGVFMAKSKRMPQCGREITPWWSDTKYLCGRIVRHKGSMCEDCRNTHLKRKLNHL